MHGSTKQLTFPGELHRGSGSAFARTRQTHGASLQYDDHVLQSASLVHAGFAAFTADAVATGAAAGIAAAVTTGAPAASTATSSRGGLTFGSLQ